MAPLLLALLVACQPDPAPSPPPTGGGDGGAADTADDSDDTGGDVDDEPVAQLDDIALLTRLSLDLRGTRPTLSEIAAVQADPAALDGLVDQFLQDERFIARVGWIWNDVMHTAVWGAEYTRIGDLRFDQWRAMGQEPLQIVKAVVDEDRPFTDIVSASEVRVHPTTAALWGDPAPAGSGWSWGQPGDARPVAGVLSSTALWLRYTADELNYNRLRANAVARMFLCADFLAREGAFTFAISPESLTSVEDAVRSEPACLTCHASLDPLAGFFGGWSQKSDAFDTAYIVRWSDHQAQFTAARQPPAYYGAPGADLADLGALIAADPRFVACSAEHFYTGLVGDAPPDPATREALATAFADRGLVARELVRHIVSLEAYGADGDRVLTTEQLHSTLADLLWWNPGGDPDDGLNPLSWSVDHRLMAGGTDDIDVLQRNRTPGIGLQVLLAHIARRAAPKAVEADLARPLEERRVVPVALDADEAAVREGLALVRTRFLSVPVTAEDPSVERLVALWQASGGASDPQGAWTVVVQALIRHPSQVLY